MIYCTWYWQHVITSTSWEMTSMVFLQTLSHGHRSRWCIRYTQNACWDALNHFDSCCTLSMRGKNLTAVSSVAWFLHTAVYRRHGMNCCKPVRRSSKGFATRSVPFSLRVRDSSPVSTDVVLSCVAMKPWCLLFRHVSVCVCVFDCIWLYQWVRCNCICGGLVVASWRCRKAPEGVESL